MVKSGNVPAFLSLLGFVIVFFTIYHRGRTGRLLANIRRLPALEALPQAVGRAAELGRPVIFTFGNARLFAGQEAPQALAGLSVLRHICRLAGQLKVKVLSTTRYGEYIPILDATMKDGFLEGGSMETYNPATDIGYWGTDGYAWYFGTMGLIARVRAAAVVMIGYFGIEALMFTEAASMVDAVQIGGTAALRSLTFLVAGCDQSLIAEEMYAASAYLSQDKAQIATIFTQDLVKLTLLILVVIGSIASTFGFSALAEILAR